MSEITTTTYQQLCSNLVACHQRQAGACTIMQAGLAHSPPLQHKTILIWPKKNIFVALSIHDAKLIPSKKNNYTTNDFQCAKIYLF